MIDGQEGRVLTAMIWFHGLDLGFQLMQIQILNVTGPLMNICILA